MQMSNLQVKHWIEDWFYFIVYIHFFQDCLPMKQIVTSDLYVKSHEIFVHIA